MQITVICYGLRTDYKARLFPGSEALYALADKTSEMETVCASCAQPAKFNARYDLKTGEYITEGEQVQIDDGSVGYKPLCPNCYIEKVGLETDETIIYAHYNKILTRGRIKNV